MSDSTRAGGKTSAEPGGGAAGVPVPVAPAHPRAFRPLLLASLAFHAAIFLACLAGLCRFTARLDNDFARAALGEHAVFALRTNLALLPMYALLALAGTVVLYPAARAAAARGLRPAGIAALAFPALALLHLLAAVRFYRMHPEFADGPVQPLTLAAQELAPRWLAELLLGERIVAAAWLGGALLALWYAALGARAFGRLTARARRQVGAGVGLAGVAIVGFVAVGFAGGAVPGLSPIGAASAAAATAPARPLNLLILGSDSLRADHLGINGYPRPTTPRLDAWGARAVNFQQAYVPAASTLESWLSFLTGQYPHTHGIRQMFPARAEIEAVPRRSPLLPALLRRAGYRTAAIGDWCSSMFHLADFGFDEVEAGDWQAFSSSVADATARAHIVLPWYFHNELGHKLYPTLRTIAKFTTPEIVVGRIERRLEEYARADRPFCLVGFLSCTHLPYHCYGDYNRLFCDPAYDGPLRYGLNFEVDKFIRGQTDFPITPRDVQQVVDLYDGCVRQFDDCAGRVLDTLDRLGLADRTVVLVTSDHGDDLYEPGVTIGHGVTFLGGDQGNRIPFLLRAPGFAPRNVERIVRSIDLAPTLYDLLGLPPPAGMDGVSLRPYLAGTADDLGLEFFGETTYLLFQRSIPGVEPVAVPRLDRTLRIDPDFSYNLVLRDEARAWVMATKQRCIRTERWKLVRIPCAQGEVVKLFDVTADPHCERDLAGQGLAIERELFARLERWEADGGRADGGEGVEGGLEGK